MLSDCHIANDLLVAGSIVTPWMCATSNGTLLNRLQLGTNIILDAAGGAYFSAVTTDYINAGSNTIVASPSLFASNLSCSNLTLYPGDATLTSTSNNLWISDVSGNCIGLTASSNNTLFITSNVSASTISCSILQLQSTDGTGEIVFSNSAVAISNIQTGNILFDPECILSSRNNLITSSCGLQAPDTSIFDTLQCNTLQFGYNTGASLSLIDSNAILDVTCAIRSTGALLGSGGNFMYQSTTFQSSAIFVGDTTMYAPLTSPSVTATNAVVQNLTIAPMGWTVNVDAASQQLLVTDNLTDMESLTVSRFAGSSNDTYGVITVQIDSAHATGIERTTGHIVVGRVQEDAFMVSVSTLASDSSSVGVTVDPGTIGTSSVGNLKFRNDFAVSNINFASIRTFGLNRMWVCNQGGNELTVGDMITSSSVMGTGMLQSDNVKHNYTIAKCMMPYTFSSSDESCTSSDGTSYLRASVWCMISA